MGGGTTLLERIDDLLEEELPPLADDLQATLDECDQVLDNPDEGINILPTAIDEAELCIAFLAETTLPLVARHVGMPTTVLLGQRSIYTYEI